MAFVSIKRRGAQGSKWKHNLQSASHWRIDREDRNSVETRIDPTNDVVCQKLSQTTYSEATSRNSTTQMQHRAYYSKILCEHDDSFHLYELPSLVSITSFHAGTFVGRTGDGLEDRRLAASLISSTIQSGGHSVGEMGLSNKSTSMRRKWDV